VGNGFAKGPAQTHDDENHGLSFSAASSARRICAKTDLKVPPLLVLERCYGTISWRTAIVGRAFVD